MEADTGVNATIRDEQIKKFNNGVRNKPSDMLFWYWWTPVVISLLTGGVYSRYGFDIGNIGGAFKDLIPNIAMYIPSCLLVTFAVDAYDKEIAYNHVGRKPFAEEKGLHVALMGIPIVAILLSGLSGSEYLFVQASALLLFASVPLTIGVLVLVACSMRPAAGAVMSENAHLRLPIEAGAVSTLAIALALLNLVLISAHPYFWTL